MRNLSYAEILQAKTVKP